MRPFYLTLLLATLLGAGASAQTTAASGHQARISAASAAFDAGNFAQAASIYAKLAEENPVN
jgi:hypothetical protein